MDRCHLLGDVDGHRAPGDTAPAAHATGGPELVDPGRELLGHPLAIARAGRLAHAAAVHVGVFEREARVPDPRALAHVTRQVGHVLDARAEAGGTHHRAVAAAHEALRDRVPARVL